MGESHWNIRNCIKELQKHLPTHYIITHQHSYTKLSKKIPIKEAKVREVVREENIS